MAAAIMFLGGFEVGIYESITGEFVSGSSFWWFLTFFAGFLAGFWIQFASGARRLHDIRESGWMQAIPIVNIWALVLMIFKASRYDADDSVYAGADDDEKPTTIVRRNSSDTERNIAGILIVALSLIYATSAFYQDSGGTYY